MGAFFLAEIFEKVSFDPYNFRITRLSARKSEHTFNNAMFIIISGFKLYSRWVPLKDAFVVFLHFLLKFKVSVNENFSTLLDFVFWGFLA